MRDKITVGKTIEMGLIQDEGMKVGMVDVLKDQVSHLIGKAFPFVIEKAEESPGFDPSKEQLYRATITIEYVGEMEEIK